MWAASLTKSCLVNKITFANSSVNEVRTGFVPLVNYIELLWYLHLLVTNYISYSWNIPHTVEPASHFQKLTGRENTFTETMPLCNI